MRKILNEIMKKTLLVDLSELKNLYCGLGQVALSYGNHFRKTYRKSEANYSLTLLIPKKMFGMFGNEVNYLNSRHPLRRLHRWFFPVFDIWHSTHQLSRFKPSYSRSKQTKLILTIHDLNYLYETKGKRRKRKHRRLQKKVDRADEIVCISEFAKQDVEKNLHLNGKECRVIYNGVSNISIKPSAKPNIDINKPFFFSIGVLNVKKNFHVLLDMMKLMPDKHLYLAGMSNTEYGILIRKRIKNESINNITLMGPVSAEEKVWLFANCEAFLFPSLFEGFGLPVIEAMQFGKPVFSSQKTSLKEIGGDFAYFWDNFEANEMKDIIENNLKVFYSDKDLIVRQIEYANSFSYKKHFDEYEKLYSEI